MQARDQLGHTTVVMTEHTFATGKGKKYRQRDNCGTAQELRNRRDSAKFSQDTEFIGAPSRNRTGKALRPADFKSAVFTNFTIGAAKYARAGLYTAPGNAASLKHAIKNLVNQ